MKPDSSDIYTGVSNLSDVTRGVGRGGGEDRFTANGGGDGSVGPAAVSYRPASPGMNSHGDSLAPDFPGSVDDSGGSIDTRIMDNSIDYTWPGSSQGSLEPLKGGGIKGA